MKLKNIQIVVAAAVALDVPDFKAAVRDALVWFRKFNTAGAATWQSMHLVCFRFAAVLAARFQIKSPKGFSLVDGDFIARNIAIVSAEIPSIFSDD